MAGEIQIDLGPSYTGIAAYAILRSVTGTVFNTASLAFEAFNSSNITDYDIALTEQGASGYFVGDVPAAALATAIYATIKQQAGESPAVSDNSIGGGELVAGLRAALGMAAADLDTQLDAILNLAEADREIDTTTTPWEEVVKIRGTATEILRRKLRDTNGQSVAATSQVIGSAKES